MRLVSYLVGGNSCVNIIIRTISLRGTHCITAGAHQHNTCWRCLRGGISVVGGRQRCEVVESAGEWDYRYNSVGAHCRRGPWRGHGVMVMVMGSSGRLSGGSRPRPSQGFLYCRCSSVCLRCVLPGIGLLLSSLYTLIFAFYAAPSVPSLMASIIYNVYRET